MSLIHHRLGRNDVQHYNSDHFNTYRFLAGKLSLEGIVAHSLVDTWTAVESNQNKTGFTFNALDSELMKRVN